MCIARKESFDPSLSSEQTFVGVAGVSMAYLEESLRGLLVSSPYFVFLSGRCPISPAWSVCLFLFLFWYHLLPFSLPYLAVVACIALVMHQSGSVRDNGDSGTRPPTCDPKEDISFPFSMYAKLQPHTFGHSPLAKWLLCARQRGHKSQVRVLGLVGIAQIHGTFFCKSFSKNFSQL
mmetsp:Transcript_42872/g.110546  ORF Transcript_42872/g.110546 Transcript_42872/m.110546 type:complete len:177 (+) Transcript_42872:1305-1835(+)